jgi:outer membrane scaffolding protein for murein synthesis (MipA/OmpV family)
LGARGSWSGGYGRALIRWIALAAAACTLSPAAIARDRPADGQPQLAVNISALDRDMVMIGGGIGLIPDYEGSSHYILVPFGGIRGNIRGISFASSGTQLSVDVMPQRVLSRAATIHLGPVINLNLNRYFRAYDARVRALGRRDPAIEMGGYVELSANGVLTGTHDLLSARLSWMHDISDVHDSYIFSPSVNYATPLTRHAYMEVSGIATFVGDGYARTYFAVDETGSRASGLPLFPNPRGGLKSLGVNAVLHQSIEGGALDGFGFYTALSYNRLQGDFAKSPIVSDAGNADQWVGTVGLGYTF